MIQIRRLAVTDVDAVLGIEAASPEAAAWNRQAYEAILAGASLGCCLVAEMEQDTVGFACFRIVDCEAELLNLGVLPAFRRVGIGTRLVEQVLQEASRSGVTDLFLEVRSSNLAALAFYKRFGFELKSRRKKYYSHPPADALILHRLLTSSGAESF